ncbi:MAG: hypothetical protein ACRDLP_09840 [Solirubrobacteraceae bacterium]
MIDDARARQRAHRRAGAVVVLAVLAIGLWLGFSGGGGGASGGAARAGRPPTPLGGVAAQGPPTITTSALPRSVYFSTIEPYGRSLLLSGSGSSGEECFWVLVAPRTLRVRETLRSSCATPAIAAQRFVPLDIEHPDLTASVRIARPNRDPRRIMLGPAIMRHNEVSDTHLEWAYGDGLLWIYDVAALDPGAAALHQGRRDPHAEVVEVSLRSGRVVRTVRTPRLYRPYVLADTDGLWIAPSPETSGGSPSSTYLLAPGSGSPRVVYRAQDASIWVVASGQALWEDVRTLHQRTLGQTLWQLDGASGAARRVGSIDGLAGGSLPVLETGTRTLWTLNSITDRGTNNTCTHQQVIAIDGASGARRVVARFDIPLSPCEPVPYNQPFGGGGSGEVFADGAFYFLDAGEYGGAATLYRVSP